MSSKLFEKIYGALIGVAIGDAFNAPTELMTRDAVGENRYNSREFLELINHNISPHGIWSNQIGSYTDDTRLTKIVLSAMVQKENRITKGDLKKSVIEYWINAKSKLEKEFIEEYYYKAIYDDEKEVFGGQMTNGAIMSVVPFGVINMFKGDDAYEDARSCLFYSSGYAKTAAAIAAATVSFAFEKNTTPKAIALKAIEMSKTLKSKVEGESWQSWDMYECVANEMENKVKEVIKLAEEKGLDAIDDIVKLASKDFFADGAETLILAIAAFVMSNSEFSLCMEICRKMLRDCDSSGAVAGGICGAFCGISKIPQEWISLVETCNQEKTMFDYAKEIENIIIKNNDKIYCNAISIKTLANS